MGEHVRMKFGGALRLGMKPRSKPRNTVQEIRELLRLNPSANADDVLAAIALVLRDRELLEQQIVTLRKQLAGEKKKARHWYVCAKMRVQ